jgi:hypothetical protein
MERLKPPDQDGVIIFFHIIPSSVSLTDYVYIVNNISCDCQLLITS